MCEARQRGMTSSTFRHRTYSLLENLPVSRRVVLAAESHEDGTIKSIHLATVLCYADWAGRHRSSIGNHVCFTDGEVFMVWMWLPITTGLSRLACSIGGLQLGL